MLAPAEFLQMEEDAASPICHGPRRRTTHDFTTFHPPQVVDGSPSRTTTLSFETWSSFAPSRLRVKPLPWLAAALVLVGTYFLGHAAYIQAKAVLAQTLLDSAWETTLATGKPTKAWAWADTWPIARISFPTLDRTAVVLEEAGGEALAFGPAHVAASPKPGANGVSVIGGHRDTHFRFIKDLKPGDEIDVQTGTGQVTRYRMTGSAIVHAGASGIATNGKTPRLALVTCYPFDSLQHGPLRYVVFAEAK